MKNARAWSAAHTYETLLVVFLLAVAGTAHGWNMFGFPYYENDEGTYMSQAWAVLELGRLAPYTYWYDHAPGGWLLIALFAKLTGGFFTWGFSVNSGRVLMLMLHVLSCLLLYVFAKKLTHSRFVGAVAVLLFALSPLGVQYQRRVLLDNVMTFWVLASFCLIAGYNRRLRNVVLSALCISLAVLTKESAVFFVPAALYFLYLQAHPKHRKMAVVLWSFVAAVIISVYPLYALLKQEFFIAGTLLGGDNPHVSLLETLRWQATRDGGVGPVLFLRDQWLKVDPLIVVLGGLATLVNLIVGWRSVSARIISLSALAFCVYLFRGGSLIVFYILPLLPFLALNVAHLVWQLGNALRPAFAPRLRPLAYGVAAVPAATFGAVAFLLVPGNTYAEYLTKLYTAQPTAAQLQAVGWLLDNVGRDETVLIDNYAYVDLNVGAQAGSNFEYYWKADTDPDIQTDLLGDDYRNVDVMMVTQQVRDDVRVTPGEFPLVEAALHNFTPVKRFKRDGYEITVVRNGLPTRDGRCDAGCVAQAR